MTKFAVLPVVILIVGTILGGCAGTKVKPNSVSENCNGTCRLPCDATVPLWRPADSESPNAWDSYVSQVTLPLVAKVEACDLARVECVKCLDRLKDAKVTK